MASLALLVAIIFLIVILLIPLTVILYYYNFKVLSFISSILCLILGTFWISVVPFPVSLIGYLEITCGFIIVIKILNKL